MKKIINYISFFIVQKIINFLEKIPFQKRILLTRKISLFFYKHLKKRKHLILTNLKFAFPNSNEDFQTSLLKSNFDYMGRLLSEILQVSNFNFDFIQKHMIFKPSLEEISEIYKNGGLFISGHFACWEWMIASMGLIRKNYNLNPAYAFFRRQSNFLLNEHIEKIRSKSHIGVVYAEQNPKIALNILKKGGFMAFCADQHAGGSGILMPFLNRIASIHRGPAYFARVSNIKKVYFLWAYYKNEKVINEIVPLNLPSLYDRIKEPKLWEEEFTLSWIKLLEEKIKKYPESYFWIHNRWKAKQDKKEEISKYWNNFSKRLI